MRFFGEKSKEAIAEQLRRQEISHAERIKALEMGQALPEVEKLRAETFRTNSHAVAASMIVRALFMVLGPAAICGIATGATDLVLMAANRDLHLYFIGLIWGAAVLISVVIVAGIAVIGRQVRWPFDQPSDSRK